MTFAPDKDAAQDLLKSKAMLLLRRERELTEFRLERDRVSTWLEVSHSLSRMLEASGETEILSNSVALLVDHLGFEVATVFRCLPGETEFSPLCVVPNTRSMTTIPISPGGRDSLTKESSGRHDATEAADRSSIAEGTGLEKYYWLSFPGGDALHLLIAGYSANAAPFQTLTASDEGHFVMFGSHLAALMRNAELVKEIWREQKDLRSANELLREEMAQRERIEAELRMAQKLKAVGRLAAGIAHEINTPIQYIGDNTEFLRDAFREYETLVNSIRTLLEAEKSVEASELGAAIDGFLQQADLEFLNEEIPDAIDQTVAGVDRVSTIVRAMREFAHPGSNEKAPVDINRAIETSVTVSRNEWKYVAEVVTDLGTDLPQIPALAGEVNQVLLNLIVNAAQAMKDKVELTGEKGAIRISTGLNDDWYEIRVADNGPGIPVEIQEDVFTPFFTTKDVGEGTGQGLALARSVVVDKHQGKLHLESVPGEGATFIVRLPVGTDINRQSEA